MPRQPINTGTVPGDGTGDKLYEAFGKVNANETELYANVATAQATADGAIPISDKTTDITDTTGKVAVMKTVQSSKRNAQKLQVIPTNYVSDLGTEEVTFTDGTYLYTDAIDGTVRDIGSGYKTFTYTYEATNPASYFEKRVYVKGAASGASDYRTILVTDQNGVEVYKTNRKGNFTFNLRNDWTIQATCSNFYHGITEASIEDKITEFDDFKEEIEKVIFYQTDFNSDEYDLATFVFGSYYNVSGGLVSDSNYYYQTSYSKVFPNQDYTYTGGIFQSRYIIFYDKDKQVIGSKKSFSGSLDTEVDYTTPEGCYFTRHSIEISKLSTFKLVYKNANTVDAHSNNIVAKTNESNVDIITNRVNGYGLFSFLNLFRNSFGTNRRVNILGQGDSLTAGTDKWSWVDSVYEMFGIKNGYGGVGYIPCHSEQKGDQINAIGYENTGWLQRNQTQDSFGSKGCFTRCLSIGEIGSGSLKIGVNQTYKDHPKYEFDTVRIYAFSLGADGDLRFRATDNATFGANTNGNGDWTTKSYTQSLSATPNVEVTTITGFGASTGRYVLEIDGSLITGFANIYIGAIELINSKGGVTVQRMAIGGYKASDHTGQYDVAQEFYYTTMGIDATIINLGENDSATSDVDFKADMNETIARIKSARPDTPIYLVHWFSLVHDEKRRLIDEIAEENDLLVIDVKTIIPNWTYAYDNDLLNTPGTPNDPHLNATGSNYVGSLFAKTLSIDTCNADLQAE